MCSIYRKPLEYLLFFFSHTFFRLQRCVRSPPRVTPLRCLTRPSCRYARRSEARCRSVTAAAGCWAPGQLQGGGPLRWGDPLQRWAVRASSIRLRQHCKPRAGQQPPETPTSALPSPALLLRATWRERGVLARQRGVAQDAVNRRSNVHLSRQRVHTSGAGLHGRAPGNGQACGDEPWQVRPRRAPALQLLGCHRV